MTEGGVGNLIGFNPRIVLDHSLQPLDVRVGQQGPGHLTSIAIALGHGTGHDVIDLDLEELVLILNEPSIPQAAPEQRVTIDLEYTAHFFRRHSVSNDLPSSRGQQAISAYISITGLEERDRVSELFGLNEYA